MLATNASANTPANAPPVIAVPGKPSGLQPGTEAGSLNVSVDWDDVSGADSYRVRWRVAGPGNKLNEGFTTQSSAATISVADYGEWLVRVQACNGAGCGAPSTATFTVEPAAEPAPPPAEAPPTNAPPVIAGPGDKAYEQGETIAAVDIAVTDADGDDVTVTVAGLPPGLSYANGQVSGTVAADATPQAYTATITANDGVNPDVTHAWAIDVRRRPEPVPGKPSGLQPGTEAGSLNVSVDWEDVSGADSYRVRWRVAGPGNKLNEGFTTQSSAATISVADYGEWLVRVQACNGAGCGEPLTATFTVEPAAEPAPPPAEAPPANTPPVITDPGDRTYLLGQTIRPFGIAAGDADQDSLTLTVTGLPPGLSYTNGKVQGTVAADATLQAYAVAVTADDGVNAAVTEMFRITVTARRARSTSDRTPPSVTISGPTASQSDSFDVTIAFSESVTGFDRADVTVGNGSVTAFSGSGTSYTAAITPTASGTVTVDVAANAAVDAGGNGNTAASQFTVQADLTRPTVVISGPANVQTGAFTVDIDFSESVTGFDKTDVTVGNGRVTGWAETGGSALVIITPAATGTVTVDVAANVAVDDDDNGNLAATQYSVQADLDEPTVTISCPAGVQTGAFTVDIDFSKFVTGFDQADVTVGNGRVTGWAETGGSALVIITPAATGTVTVDVAANVAVDSNGYGNLAAQQCSVQAELTPRVTIADASASEGDSLTFTVRLDRAVSGGLTVTPGFSGGTATKGTDYTENTAALTFAGTAGETRTFTVATTEDDAIEAHETFTVGLTVSGTSETVIATDTATGTINNDDERECSICWWTISVGGDGVPLTGQTLEVEEGGTVEFTLTQKVDGQRTLKYWTSSDTDHNGSADPATAVTDYQGFLRYISAGTVTFSGKGDTKTIRLSTYEDTLVERDEFYRLWIDSNYENAGFQDNRLIYIRNDDQATITVSDATGSEGGTMEFTATLDKALSHSATVTPRFTHGTTTGNDYYTPNADPITFAGTAGERKTFRISTREDSITEETETFTAGLTVKRSLPYWRFTGAGDAIKVVAGTGTIEDNNTPTLTVADAIAIEGDPLTFTVTLDNAVPGGLTVTPSFTDVTATKGTDYTANTAALEFAGTRGETKTFTVATAEDTEFEIDETFTLGLGVSGTSQTVDASTATGTIIDEDREPAVTIDDSNSGEDGAMTFTVTLDKAVPGGLTVTPGFTDVTATKGADYIANTDPLAFAGTRGETRSFWVQTRGDTEPELEETFIVSLTVSGTTETVTATDTATGTIFDDDTGTVAAAVTIGDASADEGDSLTFTVTLNDAVSGGFQVTPGFSGGTATKGADYTANTAALAFAGNAGEQHTFTVATAEDADDEANETFTVSLAVSGTTSAVTATDTATGTIIDDDGPRSVTITDATASEGDSLTFTVALNKAVPGGFRVTPSFSGGTATEGVDYTANTAALTFAGNAGERHTITVQTTEDADEEAHETFTVSLAVSGTTATVTATDTATGTIIDDDGAAAVTITDASASEGDSLTFTVTLNRNADAGELTVTPSFADGTAANGTDYTANTAALSFAGLAGEQHTFTVSTTADEVVELDETFTVSLAVSGNDTVTATDTATGTITNDDTATVTVANVSGAEGGPGFSFVVDGVLFTEVSTSATLDKAVQGGFQLYFYASAGTATKDPDGTSFTTSDFGANPVSLWFDGNAGEQQSLDRNWVAIYQDDVVEETETFNISYSLGPLPGAGPVLPPVPAGVTVDGPATGTIIDDDAATVTIADASAAEGEAITFTATLDKAVADGFTVTPGFTDGTATEGTDYTANTVALTFAGNAGETQTFTVATADDNTDEQIETFTVGLSVSGTSLPVTAPDSATGTIIDANASPAVTVSDASADEGDPMTFAVTLHKAVSGGFTVTPGFTDGTAAEGTDYTANTAALSFAGTAGEQQTLTVSTTEDAVREANETFAVSLTVSGTEQTVTATDTATGTIFDDDGDASNAPPVIVAPGDMTYEQGVAIAPFGITVADADGDTVTVTVTGLPQGLSYAAGQVQGTVAANAAAQAYTVTVGADDGVNAAVTRTFTITVRAVGPYRIEGPAGPLTTYDPFEVRVHGGFTTLGYYYYNEDSSIHRLAHRHLRVTPVRKGRDQRATAPFVVFMRVAPPGTPGQGRRSPLKGEYSVVVDPDPPSVDISGPAQLQNGPFEVTFTVSEENVHYRSGVKASGVDGGFHKDRIVVTNGSVTSFRGDWRTYVAEITPAASGAVVVEVPEGVLRDHVGWVNDAARYEVQADIDSPGVTIVGVPATVSTKDPLTVTFEFTESVTGFETSDIAVQNGTLGTLTVNGTTGSAQITPNGGGDLTVGVASGAALDAASNAGPKTAVSATARWTGTAPEQSNAPPAITAPGDKTYVQGQTITPFGIAVANEQDDTLTVTVTGLPSGLSYASGQVQGTVADEAAAQDYTATITADDGVNDAVTATFSVTVTANTPPTITALESKTYEQGETITPFGITVTDADEDPVAVTVTGLPPGLSYTLGQVQGTVNASAIVKTYTATITADDGVNDAVTATFSITVAAPGASNALPVITAPANRTYVQGETITPFGITVTDAEGDPVTVTVTGLPPGLSYTSDQVQGTVAANAATQAYTVTITANDAVNEADTAAFFEITVTPASGTPATPAVTIADASANEGDSMTFTVTLDKAVSGGFTVTPSFTDGTAAKGADYTENTAALSFAGTAGETRTFTVATTEDSDEEDAETFTVGLTVSGTTATVTATDTATGTIHSVLLKSPSPVDPAVTIADASASEGDSMTFTVTLDKAVSGGFTVTPGFTDGTAAKGADYTENTAALSFAGTAGETQTFTVATIADADAAHETFTVGLSVSGTSASVTATDTATGTIIDDGGAAVLIGNALAHEGNRITFAVVLSKPVPGGLTVTPGFSGGTATKGADYTENTAALSFAGTAGETQTFTVATTEDDDDEPDETFTVSLAVSGTSTAVATNTATGTILDDDSAPAVTIVDASADEGDRLAFTVTLDKPVWLGFKVTPSFTDGTTTKGMDYQENTESITFVGTRGEKQTFTVATTDDSDFENDETFTVSLAVSGTSETVTAAQEATGTILDDDLPSVTVEDASASEGEAMTFTVTLDQAVSGGLTVTPSFADGTATKGTDYTENTAALSFAGTAGETQSFTVATTEDADAEPDETFTVSLAVSGTSETVRTTDTATGIILDDDDGDDGDDGDEDTDGDDGDDSDDGDEDSDGDDDDDGDRHGVRATVTVADAGADEGDSITFTVTLDRAVQGGLTVTPGFTDGTAAEGADYTANTAALTFTGTAGETQTFTVATIEDAVVEAEETFRVGLSVSDAPSGVTVGDPATGTIADDDGGGTGSDATVTIAEASAVEGDALTFTVTLNRSVQGGVTVTPGFTDGTAAEGADYTANTAALTFTGTAGETQTLTVATIEDAVVEAEETFRVGLSVSDAPSGVTVGDPATGTIADDDGGGTGSDATVTIAEASAVEGDALTFTVTLNRSVQGGVTVTPGFTDGTAAEGADYTANTAALTFTGTAGETQTLTVATIEDAVVEAEETFRVGLSVSDAPSGVTVGDPATGTIADDDGGGTGSDATVTIADASGIEGDPLTFTVTLNRSVQGGLTVTPGFTDGTAVEGADYTANTAALTFTGTAGETQILTVATIDDAVVEADETFAVSLSVSEAPAGATVGDPATGTIADDDGGGTGSDATVTIAEASATEASAVEGDALTFTVTLNRSVQGGVTVTPGFTDGTATQGADYTANTAALAFTGTAGETQTLTVATVDDAVVEADETFTVGLSVSDAPSGVTAGDPSTGTIVDDDGGGTGSDATVTIAEASAVEGDALTFTVTLNRSVQGGVTVTPVFTDGTAVEGADYTANTAALAFTGTAGETQTLTVATIEDTVVEADETFTVGLSVSDAPSGVTAGDSATGTIVDDDGGGTGSDATVTIAEASAAEASAVEGDALTFTVTLNRSVQGGVTVTPVFTDGTAVEGADYTANTAALAFTGTAGETQTLTVATIDDAVVEADETFAVSLSVSEAPAGATVGDSATGTIVDDETANARRLKTIHESILTDVSSLMADGVALALSARIEQMSSPCVTRNLELTGLQAAANPEAREIRRLDESRPTLREVLGGSSFVSTPFGCGQGRDLTLWGRADLRKLSGRDEHGAAGWKGKLFGQFLGADLKLGPGAAAGAAIARFDSEFDYEHERSGESGPGTYRTRMTSVHPYVAWSAREALDLWASVGYGTGEVRFDEEEFGTQRADSRWRTAAAGGTLRLDTRNDILPDGTTTLDLRTEAWASRQQVEDNGELVRSLDVDTQRLRAMLVGKYVRELDSGAQLIPSLELGARGGSGRMGAGVETAAGLRFTEPSGRFSFDARVHTVVAQKQPNTEWGLSGSIRLSPRRDGRGLSFSVTPAYGAETQSPEQLWNQQMLHGHSAAAGRGARVQAALGYGLSALRGLLTLQSGVDHYGNDRSKYTVGGDFKAGKLNLRLELDRFESRESDPKHGLMLRGNMRF